MAMNTKPAYTATEAAAMLDTIPRTISRWLKNGVIEGTKRGRYWYISAAEVERMRKVRETYSHKTPAAK